MSADAQLVHGFKNPTVPLTSPSKQTMTFKAVTPSMAQQWLQFAKDTNFRKLDLGRVARLAEAILKAGWINDGNSFKFNSKGLLVDGQHRAAAIVKAGITVHAWICTGVDKCSTIDTGQSRTLSQFLSHNGEKNYDVLAATLNGIFRYRKGVISNNAATKISIEESLQLLSQEPLIRDSVSKGVTATNIMSAAQVATLHYVASQGGVGDLADLFVETLVKGTGVDELSAIYHLRERMLRDRSSKTKLMLHEKFALLIKAWNLWFEGKPCKVLKWTNQGPKATPFPSILTGVDHELDEMI